MIELTGISKSYSNSNKVLDDISLAIQPNEVCCLLGKNGAGKSTLINILAQIIKADEGSIKINGHELSENTILINEKVGFVTQFDHLINVLTGEQFLTFQSLIFGMDKAEIYARISSLASFFFDNEVDIYKQIKSYSSGMRMKLKIMAALIHKPKVLIMDEPFANLDLIASEKLVLIIKEFVAKDGNCALISSHDLLYVDLIATHICVLDNKSISYGGSKAEFTHNGQFAINTQLLEAIESEPITTENINWLF